MMKSSEKYLASLEKFGINLGLKRIYRLLEKLGNPQNQLKVIHVAGTNGKGSTCAMIASILKSAGYKVGLYTSPHLFSYLERYKINGQDITARDFEAGLRIIRQFDWEDQGNSPTVFEVLTALAFWYFAKEKVDYAIVEVGLGGRLDATNVITPLVSVITNIDLEHTAILGKTLGKIAYEKGGIIKPKIPVVTAETKTEALQAIKAIAKKNQARLYQVKPIGRDIKVALAGQHQLFNAACARQAIKVAGIKIAKLAIVNGLKNVDWPARFQIVKKQPLTIVDGAHNPAGAKILKEALLKMYPKDQFTFILGVQKDKNAKLMVKELRPVAKQILLTRSSHAFSSPKVAGEKTEKLPKILKQTALLNRVVAGSLFLVADTLKYLDVNLSA